MSRAPFQVLVFLRRLDANGPEYLVLKRADLSVWQGVAGGGEGDESPREAAIRETMEEVGVSATRLIDLESVAMVPILDVVGCYRWGDDVLEIPEYAFCVDVDTSVVVGLAKSMRNTDGARRAKRLICWSGIRTGRRFVWLRQGWLRGLRLANCPEIAAD
mgnify:CR=1 FL=1